ncbi:Vi polysaccharide export inner membrane protein VexD [Legionella massiliensis]|uniref:Vi polysaccharide export inner membrane protein VexD n=1 Tax=Legionella massiliensis TaxID=1034943 RepID=A0A078KY08_9GAMM|nr:hypothetical protein [Legionella massiliensis]CDZ77841.1 Vi polysaccharide export inner membrane protein VexD [Legionella massiliensis]CEE13579.1 hypothetical protein BN1094_02134 [Legionella massiliensis]
MENIIKKFVFLRSQTASLSKSKYQEIAVKGMRRCLQYFLAMDRLFLFSVVIPVFASLVYFGLIASDVYVVESQFVIRSPENKSMSGLGMFLSHSGFGRSQDDNFVIQNYILSTDALSFLEKQYQIGQHYGAKSVDRLKRFGGVTWDTSFESLLDYYKKHVTVTTDNSSSISTLTVRAFSPEKAYEINKALLKKSEALVNHINERARQDILHFASAEVSNAEQKAKKTALALLEYRQKKKVFDPIKQTAFEIQRVAKFKDELIVRKEQLRQMEAITSKNPQLPALRQQVASLENNLALQTEQVVGKHGSLSNKALGYEYLKLENIFAHKQLTAALSSLEQARIEAARQQVYLERIENPIKPASAIEPRRIWSICTTLLLSLVIWGVLSMLIAGVKEHQQ